MSIASEITRIQGNVSDSYTAANAKGATLPATQDSDHLAATIATIPSGTTPTGTLPITSNGTYDVTNYANADVQVPTTAPASYREYSNDNGTLVAKTTAPFSVDLTGITTISAYSLARVCYNNTTATTIDLSNVTTVASYGLYQAFYGATGLTGKVTLNVGGSTYSCQEAFTGSGITEIDIGGDFGQSAFYRVCADCTSLTKATIRFTGTSTSSNAFVSAFADCTALSDVDWSALETHSGSSSTYGSTTKEVFSGCTALISMRFDSLYSISRNAFYNWFYNCTNLANLYFPSVTTTTFGSYTNAFVGMLTGVDNCTIHFPSNVQAQVEALQGYSTTAPFGATAGTVLFDLPKTVTLTGANALTYERNPKFDTATALGWFDTSATRATPYYTSGTADPAVNDTIYSDSACTTAVTTIDSIA